MRVIKVYTTDVIWGKILEVAGDKGSSVNSEKEFLEVSYYDEA